MSKPINFFATAVIIGAITAFGTGQACAQHGGHAVGGGHSVGGHSGGHTVGGHSVGGHSSGGHVNATGGHAVGGHAVGGHAVGGHTVGGHYAGAGGFQSHGYMSLGGAVNSYASPLYSGAYFDNGGYGFSDGYGAYSSSYGTDGLSVPGAYAAYDGCIVPYVGAALALSNPFNAGAGISPYPLLGSYSGIYALSSDNSRSFAARAGGPAYGDPAPTAMASGATVAPPPADNAGHFLLMVPEFAEVLVDGAKTLQTGPIRAFQSPVLAPGSTYTYAITVSYKATGGKVLEDTRTIRFRPNDWYRIDFTRPAPTQPASLARAADSKPS